MEQRFPFPYGVPADLDHRRSAMAAPVVRATSFAAETAEEIRALGAGEVFGDFYPRLGHANGREFEAEVARLEAADGAVAFASGIGAVHGAILGLCRAGDRVLCAEQVYGGTHALMTHDLPRFGVEVERFDALNQDDLRTRLRRPARMVIVETPINPTLRLVDLAAVVRACRDAGVVSLCDATFAPPPIQFTIGAGVDLVMHSATKFLGGHSDVLAGVVAGRHDLLTEVERFRRRTGGILAPDAAWLLCRSMPTLPLRLARQTAVAEQLAARLRDALPDSALGLSAVDYPGLRGGDDAELRRRQMPGGGGALVTITVRGGIARARRVFEAFTVIGKAPSLGGVESLASLPAYTTHAGLTPEQALRAGIDPGMVRVSVGIEDPSVLWADLRQALAGTGPA